MSRCNSVWLSGLLLAACYNPSFTSGQFQCNFDGAECPTGYSCDPVSGRCVSGPGAADLAMTLPPPPDMSSRPPDLRRPPDDLAKPPPDLLPPPDMAPFCTKVTPASNVDPNMYVYACRGQFTAGNAAALCPAGYGLGCDDPKLGSIMTSLCIGLGGFFAGNVDVSFMHGSTNFQCNAGNGGDIKNVLVGCGTDPTAFQVAAGCHNLYLGLQCKSENGWECSKSFDPMSLVHSGSTGGVLCCKMP